jgi:hypothetical protein
MISFLNKKALVYFFIGLASFITALLIYKFFLHPTAPSSQVAKKALLDQDDDSKKSKFSFETISKAEPSKEPEAFLDPSPEVSLFPSPSLASSPSPSQSPVLSPFPSPSSSPVISPSPSPPAPSLEPSPSPSYKPSMDDIPVEVIAPIPDGQIPDFAYFYEFNEPDFGISFKYHPTWVIENNSDVNKLHFVDKNKVSLLKSRIVFAFEDPDYQLGKFEMMQVNVFNSQGNDLLEWLFEVNSQAESNFNKLVFYQINGRQFLRLKNMENQVYYSGPADKIYSFWMHCADFDPGCPGSANEKLFKKILETVN